MLQDLHIRNVAIIEEQTISFGEGLNVISGETGSGKSIILSALEFLLGGKPKNHLIRTGEEELEIQASFDLSALPAGVRQELPDLAQTAELSLSRTFNRAGRGKVFINGKLSTVTLLGEVTSKLVNICGQNQHIRLLDPRFHLSLVDGFGGHEGVVERYMQAYREWLRHDEELREREARIEQNALRQAELEFIAEELREAKLEEGLRARLEAEVKRLGRGEGVIGSARQLLDAVRSEGGLREQLSRVSAKLQELVKLDSEVESVAESLKTARLEIEEFEGDLERYAEGVEVDPEALDALRERLAEVARLERKYRTNDQGLLELLGKTERELSELGSDEGTSKLKEKVGELKGKAEKLAAELTRERDKAGKLLSKEVERELKELNMSGAKLELRLEAADLGPTGRDRGEIYLSTNKGEPLLELRRIASGGELSRIMLVLKKILKDRSGVNILVFDEVDSGISGGVARAVGQKLKQLAQHSQVICITHLAQVASLADRHFLVGKKVGKRTTSLVSELSKEERIEEIARMLAGYEVTPAARESARELVSSKN
ncbi:MAG: DNA repair protein RecN [Deltaproteobacteria bacterium]|nr:DNA repair protein RecN [Deltaproteobacteria bacterium]